MIKNIGGIKSRKRAERRTLLSVGPRTPLRTVGKSGGAPYRLYRVSSRTSLLCETSVSRRITVMVPGTLLTAGPCVLRDLWVCFRKCIVGGSAWHRSNCLLTTPPDDPLKRTRQSVNPLPRVFCVGGFTEPTDGIDTATVLVMKKFRTSPLEWYPGRSPGPAGLRHLFVCARAGVIFELRKKFL